MFDKETTVSMTKAVPLGGLDPVTAFIVMSA
jgi:hypothetical protein